MRKFTARVGRRGRDWYLIEVRTAGTPYFARPGDTPMDEVVEHAFEALGLREAAYEGENVAEAVRREHGPGTGAAAAGA